MNIQEKIELLLDLDWIYPNENTIKKIEDGEETIALEYKYLKSNVSMVLTYKRLGELKNKDDVYRYHINRLNDLILYHATVEIKNMNSFVAWKDFIVEKSIEGTVLCFDVIKNRFGDNHSITKKELLNNLYQYYGVIDNKL